MKRAVRMLILMVGLACTYAAIVPAFVHADGGIMPLHKPASHRGNHRK
jgi:hypothetical protein